MNLKEFQDIFSVADYSQRNQLFLNHQKEVLELAGKMTSLLGLWNILEHLRPDDYITILEAYETKQSIKINLDSIIPLFPKVETPQQAKALCAYCKDRITESSSGKARADQIKTPSFIVTLVSKLKAARPAVKAAVFEYFSDKIETPDDALLVRTNIGREVFDKSPILLAKLTQESNRPRSQTVATTNGAAAVSADSAQVERSNSFTSTRSVTTTLPASSPIKAVTKKNSVAPSTESSGIDTINQPIVETPLETKPTEDHTSYVKKFLAIYKFLRDKASFSGLRSNKWEKAETTTPDGINSTYQLINQHTELKKSAGNTTARSVVTKTVLDQHQNDGKLIGSIIKAKFIQGGLFASVTLNGQFFFRRSALETFLKNNNDTQLQGTLVDDIRTRLTCND